MERVECVYGSGTTEYLYLLPRVRISLLFHPPLFFNLSLFVSIEKKGFKKIKIKKKTKKSHQ